MTEPTQAGFPERPGTFDRTVLREELRPNVPRLRSALKLALAGTVTLVLVFRFDWPSPQLSVIPVLIIGRPDIVTDLPGAMRGALAILVIGTLYYLILSLVQEPLWFCLTLGALFTVLGALSATPGFGIAFFQGMVLGAQVLVIYFYEANPRETLFLSTSIQLLLGFMVALTVNHLLWPYSPRQQWDEHAERTLRECRQAVARWFAGVRRPSEETRHLDRFFLANTDILSRIIPVDPEDPGVRLRVQASYWLEEMITQVRDLEQKIHAGNDDVRRFWAASAPRALECLGAALAAGFGPPGQSAADDETSWRELEAALRALPADPGVQRRGESILENLRGLDALLASSRNLRAALARLKAEERFTRRRQTLRWTPPLKWRDFLQVGAAEWKRGVQIALSVIVVFWLWQALTWPNGATVLVSAIIVNLQSVGASQRRLILRLLGVGLGIVISLAATILVVPHLQTMVGYGTLFFLVLGFFGYLAATGPRTAYVGFQGAVTFVLTFLGGPVQSVDLDPLRGRAIAVVLGVLISGFIQQVIWPTRRVNPLYRGIARTFAGCAGAWTALLRTPGGEAGRSARRETFVAAFNQDFSSSLQLQDDVEFEGGDGSSHYGHAGAMLVQLRRLFRQMLLFGDLWSRLTDAGRADVVLRRPLAELEEKFHTLVDRFGQAAIPPPDPLPDGSVSHDISSVSRLDPPRDGAKTEMPHAALDERIDGIKAALEALDELTGRPAMEKVTSA